VTLTLTGIEAVVIRHGLREYNFTIRWLCVRCPSAAILFVCLSIYSCCSHLEYRAPVKCFVSLQFLNLKTVDSTPWTGDQPDARPLPTSRTTQTQNKSRQTSMSWVGFEPTTPGFERAKTVSVIFLGPIVRALKKEKRNMFVLQNTLLLFQSPYQTGCLKTDY
jgi:hypothetical protein